MSNINTGGPAWPTSLQNNTDQSFPGWEDEELKPGARADYQGLSVRDWFAGQALSGMMAANWNTNYDDWAEHAYRLADAMLKAREGA